jgi:ParB family transcriptional regulator, chromosome partitioning protein
MSTNRNSKGASDQTSAATISAVASLRVMRMVAVATIDPDANNRAIDEHDEAFSTLVDSVRVLGVLDPIQVRTHGDRYQLIDGERRWRAAHAVGLAEIPCYVWPASAAARETIVAGVVLNEQRQAHRCIHVARRLRELKNTNGLTGEQLAGMTGLTVDRVKTYLCLFNGSEFLLDFFARHDVPLAIAAELIRYEKATNEARARAVALKHLETPLTREDLVRLRKQASEHGAADSSPEGARARTGALSRSVQRAWSRDPESTRTELETALHALGFRLVPVECADGGVG